MFCRTNGNPNLLYILISNEIVRAAAGTIVRIMFVSMMADTLDKQELETGRRQEGVFSSALSFAGKPRRAWVSCWVV